jgi:hypothetical protein
VTFDGNGATGGSMENQIFTYGVQQALTANAFTREYAVTYNAQGGTGSPAGDVSAFAFWGW